MSRSRGYSFTVNNYTDEDLSIFEDINFKKQVKYYVYGKEIGEKGTPHLQGYVFFQNAKTLTAVKKYLKRAHLEISKGSPQENIAYCTKEKEYVEYGEQPRSGTRNDLKKLKDLVLKEDKQIYDIVSEHVENYQQLKFVEGLLKYKKSPQDNEKKVFWYYGSTGTGKTKEAIEFAKTIGEEYYISMNTLRWWDGYTGQKVVILDDFRKDFCTFHELLRILDRYPYRVQYKGGSIWLQAKYIFITSCYSPREVYDTREDIEQLIRRIYKIKLFKNKNLNIRYKQCHTENEENAVLDVEDTESSSESIEHEKTNCQEFICTNVLKSKSLI